jgi:predicted esterase
MNIFKLTPFLFICFFSFSQSEYYEKGKITDSIRVKGSATESYQLYLPKSYNSNENSAIIFIYDPAARGTVGIRPFIKAAEKYNYILVCSNDSKNGPYDENFEIANRLFEDVFSKFKTDPKQIYTAGFSGGSRLATTVAVLSNAIQGVIGCGAGFMTNISAIEHPNSFSYIGLVGDEDMNYQEMFRFKDWLKTYAIDNELLTYEDRHSWPPQEQILRALGWLELQAYKKEIRPYRKDIVTELYHNNYGLAHTLEEDGKKVLAGMEFGRILRNFRNYFNLDSIAKKINILKTTEAYKKEAKIRREIANVEQKISNRFTTRFNEEATMGRSKDNFEWWRRELITFDASYMNNNDHFTSKMGKRLRNSFSALAYESSNFYTRTKSLEQRLYCDRILLLLHPERPYFHFRLAQTYAEKSDLKNTLFNLKKASELGFANMERIRHDAAFNKFKGKKKFDKFLRSLDN